MCLIGSMAHLGPVSLALIWTGSWSPGRWSSATTCSPAREGSEAGTGVGADWTHTSLEILERIRAEGQVSGEGTIALTRWEKDPEDEAPWHPQR